MRPFVTITRRDFFLLLEKVFTHWVKMALRYRLPFLVFAGRRLPPVSLFWGHNPAQEHRCWAEGKHDISVPISEIRWTWLPEEK